MKISLKLSKNITKRILLHQYPKMFIRTLNQPSSKQISLINVHKYNFTQNEQQQKEKTKEEPKEENKSENEKEESQETEEETKVNYKFSRKLRIFLRRIFKFAFYSLTILAIYHAYLYRKRNYLKPEEYPLFHESMYNFVKRVVYFYQGLTSTLTMPYHTKLLPENLEFLQTGVRKKTLVINLNKTLISYEYKMGTGFQILKRPGVLRFLNEVGPLYEVVIFGTEEHHFVEEIVKHLDQYNINVFHILGKEATRYEGGRYIKDLNFLGRNLKNVICIDFDPENVKYNLANTIIIPEYKGDTEDKFLLMSIIFLKELAKPNVTDVRKELDKWGHYLPFVKFYKSNPKYHKLLPKEYLIDDEKAISAATSTATSSAK